MKFMKLGTRPDSFFTTSGSIRSVTSEVPVDLKIHVDDCLFYLHKFPLLSKCLLLQKLCSEQKATSESSVIYLGDIPGGAEAFETCSKFCYGIAITLSAVNFVAVRCAAEFLGMTEAADRGNLVGKLDSFFDFCVLRRWKDALVALQSTTAHSSLCDVLGITARCVAALAAAIVAHNSSSWWAEDISELGMEHHWRILAAVKSTDGVPSKFFVEALQIYAMRWLPKVEACNCREIEMKDELLLPLMEKTVSLLPDEKGAASCSFLLHLLKLANLLNASASLRTELIRRVGLQLEEAPADDLLIPSMPGSNDSSYDIGVVLAMLDEFLLQSQPLSPSSEKLARNRTRCRSMEELRVAKIIDSYLQKIASDKNLPMEKLITIAEAVPDSARADHDDLYRAIDIYLRAHPDLDKCARKQLCRVLDCKKLSVEACAQAAQNELLPLRVVVQVLFSEHSRAAATSGGSRAVPELPGNIKALLAKTMAGDETPAGDGWSISRLKCPTTTKLETLRMKLEEDEDDMDDDYLITGDALAVRLKALCSLRKKPKRMISRLLAMNRSASERRFSKSSL
ncbi:BTB/POZ domain-containing protein [Canna indica]|uniref:BTB/POZ domain-containing protein n=1 Tax=Canna indica TaxID=4628 RepID=A0AAQ3Q6M3_9LILI|nr:BTB/POZ domain-containing protein [Canna indica]